MEANKGESGEQQHNTMNNDEGNKRGKGVADIHEEIQNIGK